jgi:hypothetical protein
VVDLDPAEGLGEERGELVLEVADLPSQLMTGQTLVDLDVERVEAVSFKQFRHRPPTECKSRFRADKPETIKASRP